MQAANAKAKANDAAANGVNEAFSSEKQCILKCSETVLRHVPPGHTDASRAKIVHSNGAMGESPFLCHSRPTGMEVM